MLSPKKIQIIKRTNVWAYEVPAHGESLSPALKALVEAEGWTLLEGGRIYLGEQDLVANPGERIIWDERSFKVHSYEALEFDCGWHPSYDEPDLPASAQGEQS